MYQPTQTKTNLLSVTLLMGLGFILLALFLGGNASREVQPAHAAVAAPFGTPSNQAQSLPAAQGVSADMIIGQQVQGVNEATINGSTVFTVTAGSPVTYVVLLRNSGFITANSVVFRYNAPNELQASESPVFARPAIPSGTDPRTVYKEWTFIAPFAAGDQTVITITGILTSQRTSDADNIVEVQVFDDNNEPQPELSNLNNSNTVTVRVIGSQPGLGPAYLPLIVSLPTPTPTNTPTPDVPATNTAIAQATADALATQNAIATATALAQANETAVAAATVTAIAQATANAAGTATAQAGSPDYFADFNDDDGWASGDFDPDPDDDNDGECRVGRDGSRYEIDIDADGGVVTCFVPGPSDAEFRFGSAEVDAYQSGGNNDATHGVYINGAGGSTLYLLRVRPNRYLELNNDDDAGNDCSDGGQWAFYRLSEDDDSDEAQGRVPIAGSSCDEVVERGVGTGDGDRNVLRIRHEEDGDGDDIISVFINGTRVYNFEDDDPLTGSGVGILGQSSSSEDVRFEFDNFTMYEFDD